MRWWRLTACFVALAACGTGDGGPNGGVDAEGDVVLGGDATGDATIDAMDGGPGDAGGGDAFVGDAMPLGDGACTTPPFASLMSTCGTSSINCMSDKGVQCVGDAAACINIDGYATGRVIECGTPSDCGGLRCCLNSTISFTPGCPDTAAFGADTRVTNCAPSDAGCYGIRICRAAADCADLGKPCTDTVFTFNGKNEPVHFGICY